MEIAPSRNSASTNGDMNRQAESRRRIIESLNMALSGILRKEPPKMTDSIPLGDAAVVLPHMVNHALR
jgi:hypothetical protein